MPSSAGMTAAALSGGQSARLIAADLQPGVAKQLTLVYDVPKDHKKFKLHIPAGTLSLEKDATITVY